MHYRLRKFLSFLKGKMFVMKNGITAGYNFSADYNVKIHLSKDTKCVVGNNVRLCGYKKGYHAAMTFPTTILIDNVGAKVTIGDNCRIVGAYIHAKSSITIGKNSLIASGAQILDSNGHNVYSTNRTIGQDSPLPIVLGENIWVGINVIILKGTVIGNNCVIGANSVVKGEFEANSIIQGNPAKIVNKIDIL